MFFLREIYIAAFFQLLAALFVYTDTICMHFSEVYPSNNVLVLALELHVYSKSLMYHSDLHI